MTLYFLNTHFPSLLRYGSITINHVSCFLYSKLRTKNEACDEAPGRENASKGERPGRKAKGHGSTEEEGSSASPPQWVGRPGADRQHGVSRARALRSLSLRSFLKCAAAQARQGLALKPLACPGPVSSGPRRRANPGADSVVPSTGLLSHRVCVRAAYWSIYRSPHNQIRLCRRSTQPRACERLPTPAALRCVE